MHDITAIILTFNEEANLARTLSALDWAERVVVVDSFSTDATKKIAEDFPNTQWVENEFVDSATQCNFALENLVHTPWVLSMDADYVVSNQLAEEIQALDPDSSITGFQIEFDYAIDGKILGASLYPERLSLYRRDKAHYVMDGHTQRVVVDGVVSKLTGRFIHDDRKPLSRWLNSQYQYAEMEATKFSLTRFSNLGWPDKVRCLGLGPLVIAPYLLITKRLVFDGRHGLKYAGQRFLAECILLWARIRRKRIRFET